MLFPFFSFFSLGNKFRLEKMGNIEIEFNLVSTINIVFFHPQFVYRVQGKG